MNVVISKGKLINNNIVVIESNNDEELLDIINEILKDTNLTNYQKQLLMLAKDKIKDKYARVA